MTSLTKKEHIVVVGGGFAGLNAIKALNKEKYDITLIDRNNFHSFPPLFYQIASSGLDSGSISFPFRRETRKMENVKFQMGEVRNVDTTAKTITTQFETLNYDKLIISAGTTNNFFGMNNLLETVYTLKSTAEAIRLKNEILDRLERASLCKDASHRRELLSFVVIGAGPTGVEVAGALGEMKRYILQREYPEINKDDISITLIEGTDRVLRTMSKEASQKAYEYLGHLMVDVVLEKTMTKYENNVATLSDGKEIYCETLVWTAGITGEKIEGFAKETFGPGNRFIVDQYNRVKGYNDIYALGDIAFLTSDEFQRGYPQMAQVAIQQAINLARNLNGESFKKPFSYKDKGSMATVGRNRAVADLNHLHLYGRPAWLTWMFIHLISLLGMRNKINVLINWVWAYFTYSTSLRLLVHTAKYPLRRRWDELGH
ncbi:MAG: NAD(P)/FAD-dependent oxidoreductase [Muribaculaceae bacterium]|nr:NAD(P)/FAD-dependent oxidoreductase [Muribaculaceae bacterium]